MENNFKIITFDVEHGSNHVMITPNEKYIMIDAGSKEEFSPALHLKNSWGVENLAWFTITHFDSDHLTDITNVAEHLPASVLHHPDIDEIQLSELYTNEFSTPLEVFLEYRKRFGTPVPPMSHSSYDWGGVQFATFSNSFNDFEHPNINDLSIVTFASYMGWNAVFPGDLEKPGWKKLLLIPEFKEWMSRVDIFVAAHHGRESGFCEEVFEVCSPKITIISDKSVSDTSCTDKYRAVTQGLQVVDRRTGEEGLRRVLTTRSDGVIHLAIDPEGRYKIITGFSY